ncbi:hypothetical protein ACIHCQ_27820 [Streptomyces sp. NPDC052236]|uniref:hypothetical protein n=1 Tax=Streptomyces sp. NPDC052236 TaxID=3365686 RepID=UPI0037D77E28
MVKSREIREATLDWLGHLSQNRLPPDGSGFLWEILAEQEAWEPVRDAVAAAVPPGVRGDLYFWPEEKRESPPIINDAVLLDVSGLASAVHAIDAGATVSLDELAADFARFCTGPKPVSEDWLLLEANFPAVTQVSIGEYNLQTFTADELNRLQPLPAAQASLPNQRFPAQSLAGAPFLHRLNPERPLAQWGMEPQWDMRSREELLHWKPMLPLLLWSPELTRVQALYKVERGRRVRLDYGQPIVVNTYEYDEDAGEYVDRDEFESGSYRVEESELERFAAFCQTVNHRLEEVLAGSGKAGKKRARRLTRASKHLVRATHRTYGGVMTKRVPEDETEEVLLQYVIAMEALLADENNLDLSRKVAYRAATLWQADEQRQKVAKLVKDAYTERSKYVHGDDLTGRVSLGDLREVASQTLLRWLILATSDAQDIPNLADEAMLSDTVRRTSIIEPVDAFFASYSRSA